MTKNSVARLTVKRLFSRLAKHCTEANTTFLQLHQMRFVLLKMKMRNSCFNKLLWPHFQGVYELKPETQPKCKKKTCIQSSAMPKQQYNQSTLWQLRRLYGMLQLPQIQSICVFAGQKISPCALYLTCKPAPFNDWLVTAKPPDFIGGQWGFCPLLKTYQLSGNCFPVHDSQLFPGHDHSAADNSKPAAVFKSRSIV